MYIPKEIKVRIRYETHWDAEKNKYNKNDESCTNPNLGYVTYCDEKGKLRKEGSWSRWGDKFLSDFKNTPKNGFRLESAVSRSRDWFGSGKTMFRIVHPDNFIFEISANNLNEIILSCNLIKGEIDDECVLAWDGLNVALIPCSTESYIVHAKTTERIETGALKPSDLIIGNAYQDRNGKCIGHYVGRFYSLTHEHNEYDIDGKNWSKADYWERRIPNNINLTTIVLHPKQEYYFKSSDSDFYHTYVTPKVYNSDIKPKIIEKDFVPERQIYYDPIIPDDLVKRKDADGILKWAEENRNIISSIFNVETTMKFEVKF